MENRLPDPAGGLFYSFPREMISASPRMAGLRCLSLWTKTREKTGKSFPAQSRRFSRPRSASCTVMSGMKATPQPAGRELPEDLLAAGFQRNLRRHGRPVQVLQEHPAEAAGMRGQQQRNLRQVLFRNLLFRGQRMIRGSVKPQRFRPVIQHRKIRVVHGRVQGPGNIQAPLLQLVRECVVHDERKADIHPGISPPVFRQHLRQAVVAQGFRNPQPEQAGRLFRSGHVQQDLPLQLQHLLRVGGQLFPLRRQDHVLPQPVEQQTAELLLQLPDLGRDRGLRITQQCRGGRKALRLRDLQERSQLDDRHPFRVSFSNLLIVFIVYFNFTDR